MKEIKGGEAEAETKERENGHNSDKEGGGSRDNDESMSFYDVGMMMMEHVLDEDEDDVLVFGLKRNETMMPLSRGSAFSFSFAHFTECNLIIM